MLPSNSSSLSLISSARGSGLSTTVSARILVLWGRSKELSGQTIAQIADLTSLDLILAIISLQ